MLNVLCKHAKARRFHVVDDSAYGGQRVLNHLPTNCDLTSRLWMDARLYNAPPARKPGTHGRPRKRGKRLPTPTEMLPERCRRLLFDIYGRTETARLADCKARVHKTPGRPLRVVAVESLTGGRKPQAFYSTCHDASAEQVMPGMPAAGASKWLFMTASNTWVLNSRRAGVDDRSSEPRPRPCCCTRSSCCGSPWKGGAIIDPSAARGTRPRPNPLSPTCSPL